MNEKYEKPILEFDMFENIDILTCSNCDCGPICFCETCGSEDED